MADKKSMAEKLADLIEQNSNCNFNIDNDVWYMMKGEKDQKDDDSDQITTSNEYAFSTDWYSHSSNYGAGIAEAMVILLNRRGFKITASAV